MIRIFVRETECENDESLSAMSIIELQGKLSVPNDVLPDSEEEVQRRIVEYQQQQSHHAPGGEDLVKAEVALGTADERGVRTSPAVEDPLSCSFAEGENPPQGKQENDLHAKHLLSPPSHVPPTTPMHSLHSISPGIDRCTPSSDHTLHHSSTLPPALSIGFIDEDVHFPTKRVLRIGTTRVTGSAETYRVPIVVLRRIPPAGEDLFCPSMRQTTSAPSSSSSVESSASENESDGDWCGDAPAFLCPPTEKSGRANEMAESGATHENVQDTNNSRTAEETNVEDESSVDAMYEKLIASSTSGNTEKDTPHTKTEENCGETMLFADWIEQHPEMRLLSTHFGHAPDVLEESRKRKRKKREKRGIRVPKKEDEADGIESHDNRMEDMDGARPSALPPLSRKREREEEVEEQDGASSLLSSMEVKDYEVVGIVEEFVRFNSKPSRVLSRNTACE